MIELAFTTRIPLAVMIAMGVKQWENRAAMPVPAKGRCAMTCSKSSDAREYANFLAWAKHVFKPEAFAALPAWEQVESWSQSATTTRRTPRRIRQSGTRAILSGGT